MNAIEEKMLECLQSEYNLVLSCRKEAEKHRGTENGLDEVYKNGECLHISNFLILSEFVSTVTGKHVDTSKDTVVLR